MAAAIRYEAYCTVCCGGGKTLLIGSKKACAREATSHGNLYGHAVMFLTGPSAAKAMGPAHARG